MKPLLCLVVALAACAEQPTVHLLPNPEPAHVAIQVGDRPETAPASEDDICAVLPEDGPCADACDYDALVEHVPAGVCTDFRCELTDGRVISVGACHL